MKKIELTGKRGNGSFAIVDDNDYKHLNSFKWFMDSDGYARKRNGYKHISMHQLIMPSPEGLITDHKNQNRLDNRRENLRVVTYLQSTLNRGMFKNNKSGYRGVCWNKKQQKWIACVGPKGGDRYVGSFGDILDAAKAADKRAKELYGEFAQLNFPNEH